MLHQTSSELHGSVRLRDHKSRFIQYGSPWVYSNELARADTTIKAGSLVCLESDQGKTLGVGYYNPHSLIAFRLLERANSAVEWTADHFESLISRRLESALQLRLNVYRDRINSGEMGSYSFRLCYGESDFLPGFVIDLYETSKSCAAVIQCHAAGADHFLTPTIRWLQKKWNPEMIVIKNDLDVRDREQAVRYTEVIGNRSTETFVKDNGVEFVVDAIGGQKTGYFYDHRENRRQFNAVTQNRFAEKNITVIDLFSYVGAWSLPILKRSKHAKLVAIDDSSTALLYLKESAKRSGLNERVETIKLDLMAVSDFKGAFGGLTNDRHRVVVCDPPAFSNSAKQKTQSLKAHNKCFEWAAKLTSEESLLALASCSYHMSNEEFLMVCRDAIAAAKQAPLRHFYTGTQGFDHPVLSSLPESHYLKAALFTD
jgi:23S rRNA (cytosine1962-C5)-methyltransferase